MAKTLLIDDWTYHTARGRGAGADARPVEEAADDRPRTDGDEWEPR